MLLPRKKFHAKQICVLSSSMKFGPGLDPTLYRKETTELEFGALIRLATTPYYLYTQHFPESSEKISQACYSGGIQTHDPRNSRAASHQPDHRGCPAARGSSNPILYPISL